MDQGMFGSVQGQSPLPLSSPLCSMRASGMQRGKSQCQVQPEFRHQVLRLRDIVGSGVFAGETQGVLSSMGN
jgi:hypothetical protein